MMPSSSVQHAPGAWWSRVVDVIDVELVDLRPSTRSSIRFGVVAEFPSRHSKS